MTESSAEPGSNPVAAYMRVNGVSGVKMAALLNVSTGYVSSLRKGHKRITEHVAKGLSKAPGKHGGRPFGEYLDGSWALPPPPVQSAEAA